MKIDEPILLNCCFTCKKGFYSMNNLNRHFHTKKHRVSQSYDIQEANKQQGRR